MWLISIIAERGFEDLDTKYFCELLSECKARYSTLGLYLHGNLDKVKEIEKMTGPGDCVKCMNDMLGLYLREKKPDDMEEVCKALELLSRKALSDKLREKYKGKGNVFRWANLHTLPGP